jgi:hypothetical protein
MCIFWANLTRFSLQSNSQALRLATRGDHGNLVHELLSDYSHRWPEGGPSRWDGAGLRLLRFVPTENQIEARTWDPVAARLVRGTGVCPDEEHHQFTLEYPMQDG